MAATLVEAARGEGKGKWGQNSWQPDDLWHPQHPRAVPFTETYHISTLRAYPGEQGEVFVRRHGVKKDMDLVSLAGIALHAGNCEALSRGRRNGSAWWPGPSSRHSE